MKYHPFAFWLVALIAGIFFANHFSIDSKWLLIVGVVSFIVYSSLLLFKAYNKLIFFTAFLLILCIGALRYQSSNTHISLPETKDDRLLRVQIDKLLKPSPKFNKYFATIISADTTDIPLDQKILVYIRKGNLTLHQQDKIWIYGNLQSIQEPKNPHVFDYKKYMAHKRIYYQVFSDTLVSPEHANTWQHRLSEFKVNIKQKLVQAGFSKTSQIFISSLALGDRMDLNRNFQETLSSAGVMHLFAISGLHVAIVFGFVLILLYPLLYLPRGKIVRWIIALVIIWLFAWFVDFTSSVTRAVFMISVYYITQILQRSSNIYHTLALTAFVLLLIDPNELFQVGFQLSYSAVFFIAWLYRPIRKLLPHFRKPYKNYLFDIMAISTTAQFGVMPISVYYFHKFSLLFLIGNLVIIPFASIMVITSLITVFTIQSGYIPTFWVTGTNTAFELIHRFLDYLTSYDSLILRHISWNPLQVILLIMILILLRRVLIKFRWRKLIPISAVLLIFQLTRLVDAYQYQNKNELIVFHQYKGTVIGARQGTQLDIFWNVDDSIKTKSYIVEPYALKEKITHVNYHPLWEDYSKERFIKEGQLMKFNDNTYFITQSNTADLPATDYIILTHSPKKVKDSIAEKTKRIIADGSNYPYIINRLRKQSSKVYSTAENGAFLESIQ